MHRPHDTTTAAAAINHATQLVVVAAADKRETSLELFYRWLATWRLRPPILEAVRCNHHRHRRRRVTWCVQEKRGQL
eukprot:COSAG05_NODE_3730_length_1876_cov_4.429375_4_plen_77_part_00